MNNTFLKNLAIWLLIGFLVFLIVDFYNTNNTQISNKNISYSNFLNDVKNGNVSSVQIRGNNILGKYNDGSNFTAYSPNDLGLIDKLEKNNIYISELNNPQKRNPLTLELITSLQNEFDYIKKKKIIKVVIIQSTGPSFSAGHDLTEVRKSAKSKIKLLNL